LSTAKKFAGQTALYGLSTIVQRLLSSLLTPLYTTAYLPKVYSIFSYMFSYAALLQAFLAFGMETTFFRFLNKYPDNKKQVYNNGFWAIILVSIIFMLFTIPFASSIAGFIKFGVSTPRAEFERYIRYFIAILVLDAWCVIPFAKLRADERPIKYGVVKLINILVMISLNLVFIFGIPYILKNHLPGWQWCAQWFQEGWIGYVFLSNLIASVVTLILLLPELLQVELKFDRTLFKDMWVYSWPIMIAGLSYIVNENIDKILLGKLLPTGISDHDVGVYSACARISVFLSLFIQAFRMGAEPFFFSHAKNANSGNTYARIMDYFIIMMCIIFVGVVANIEILKYYVNNKAYWVGLNVVPILLFGYVSLGIYVNLSIWYRLSDQTRYGLYISGAGAIVTIVLNVIFIPRYSYMAAAWVSLIAYTTMMVLSYILGQRNYPIPYSLKKNLIYLVSSVIIVIVSFIIFNRNLIAGNLLLLLFTATAFYSERKQLKVLFRK
jgi:O-antigen/teichoic acid export membrane protein